jgi:hypothetical protein
MESGAKGCEVVVSGKLRGQRAKSMKFVDGLMIHSGEPTNDYVDTATRHVLLRQGMYMSTAYCVIFYNQKASLWFLIFPCSGPVLHIQIVHPSNHIVLPSSSDSEIRSLFFIRRYQV